MVRGGHPVEASGASDGLGALKAGSSELGGTLLRINFEVQHGPGCRSLFITIVLEKAVAKPVSSLASAHQRRFGENPLIPALTSAHERSADI